MSSRPNIDDLFRSELEGQHHEFSDALWQRLDAQLQPERDAYHKKDRKRRAVWLLLAFLAIGGGSAWYLAVNRNSGNPELAGTQQEKNTTQTITTPQQEAAPVSRQDNNTNNNITVSPQTSEQATLPVTAKSNQPVTNTSTPVPNKTITNTVPAPGPSEIQTGKPVAVKRNNNPVPFETGNAKAITAIPVQTKKQDKPKTGKTPVLNIAPAEKQTGVQPAETVAEMPAAEVVKEEKTAPVINEPVEQPLSEQKTGTINSGIAPKQPEKNTVETKSVTDKKAKNKPVRGKTGLLVTGGTNLSSPFRKPGVYGGILVTKTIGDKHIFAGLKIANNRLDHQLVFAAKQNQPQAEKDAVIERLTILQMPFGYEFAVSKKNRPSTTFLQVGFEPAYITGLRTVYFDDRGIPGGPREEVVNSPIMSKAINRFNLSFIAGVRKQVTPRIGISLTGGYSLIDITDKQYYNRTSTNNNLKYIQAGLLFRLNK